MCYLDWPIARMSDIDGIPHILLLIVKASASNGDITLVTHCRWPEVDEIDILYLGGTVTRLIRRGPFSLKATATSRKILVR